MTREEEDTRTYKAVVNLEEQYSIWFADRELPLGWREAGKTGTKVECLAFIKEVWTDMRPLSLRKRMEEDARNPPPVLEPPATPPPRHPLGKSDLVARLEEPQPIEARPRIEPAVKAFKEQVDRCYVFVTFSRTGTELGVRLAEAECDFSAADFDAGSGTAKLVGDLVLNYNRVRFRGELDLGTMRGSGRLEFVAELKAGEP